MNDYIISTMIVRIEIISERNLNPIRTPILSFAYAGIGG